MNDMSLAVLGCGYAARLHSRTLQRLAPALPRYYASGQLSNDPMRSCRCGMAAAGPSPWSRPVRADRRRLIHGMS